MCVSLTVTYNVWANITAVNDAQWPEILARNTHISYGFRLDRYTATGRVYFEYGISPCTGVQIIPNPAPWSTMDLKSSDAKDSKWHMLTMTYDGANIRVYYDGNQVGSPRALASPGFCNDTSAGLYLANRMPGYIDDARIYSRVLSPDEVKALFNEDPVTHNDRGCIPQ